MVKRFKEYNCLNLHEVNERILARWKADDTFRRSISDREGCPKFIFYEGPPSANGHPGIHHVLARSIKDTFNRYKTMCGFQVKRKAGWDTHGLPIELSVEKELGITKKDIDNRSSEKYISVKDYNLKCRENVMKYTAEWRDLTEKMGYFVDLDHPYITYDNKYIETLWWLLGQLYKKGLLYKGYTIQPYSPAAGTGLSSHELNQPGCYRDVKDTTVTALFEVTDLLTFMDKPEVWGKVYLTAWTTTPWTLPSNTALCVGKKFRYVAVESYNAYTDEPITVILAEARLSAYFNPAGEVTTREELKDRYEAIMAAVARGDRKGAKAAVPYRIAGSSDGAALVGIHYRQLMPWVKPCAKIDRHTSVDIVRYSQKHLDKVFESENGKEHYVEMSSEAFRVISGDYVTTDDGTGIVHIAPTFGADDAKVAKDAGIPSLYLINKKGETRPMVDLQGKYYEIDDLDRNFVARCMDIEKYACHAGDYVKNAYDPRFNEGGVWDRVKTDREPDLNVRMTIEMKRDGTALRIEKHVHSYPHCWRTDKPILYYPLDSWFIKDTAVKERMVELNATINWKPESTGSGRFGNWLENLNDWNLSRSRFWGTPLPIWRDEDDKEICVTSVAQLYNEIEKSVKAGLMASNPLKDKGYVPGDMSQENYNRIDLHRPYVDDIILRSDSGKPMRRDEDLIDVWFDSGSMPYAQWHYPFENKEMIDKGEAFPADFINEGVDQTRGWFFTLHAIATMIFDSVAFKNVISSGLVLDARGNKMSKHLGNVTDPFKMISRYGADAVRFYMMTNSEPWDNLKFDPNGVAEVSRKFFGTLYNTYSFFALYANVDGWDQSQLSIGGGEAPPAEIDRWILSCLNTLIIGVRREFDNYDPTRAGRLIDSFVEDAMSNWYVRLNRKRFWGKDMSKDKQDAYSVLYICLTTVARLLAPLSPFYSDQLWQDLTGGESVHLQLFPAVDEHLIDERLEARMADAQKITSMTLALRRKVSIKVRQPLAKMMIPPVDAAQQERIEEVKALILGEVNVKELEFVNATGLLVKKVKCNFRAMGKKYGRMMKGVAQTLSALSQEEIALLERQGSIDITVEGQLLTIDGRDVDIISEDMPGWLVANDGNITVALEVTLNDCLRREGMAREIVNRVQNQRKNSGLEITDRINIILSPRKEIEEAVKSYGGYIRQQVLADNIIIGTNDGTLTDFDEFSINITITKSNYGRKDTL